MVVCKPHIRLSWGGTIGVPAVEVFTNSLALSGVTDTDSERFTRDDLASKIGEVADAVKAWFGSQDGAQISSAAHLTWVKLNKIGVDGKYLDDPNTLAFTDVPGMVTNQPAIWQQSSVVSLLTGKARGRGSRGRIYPPVCGKGVDNTGYMLQAYVDMMQVSAVKLIGDINKIHPGVPVWDGIAPRWNVCIVSNAAHGDTGLLTPVTHLYVDPIPDVQRRRVNRLPVPSVAATTTYINT